MSKSSLKLDMQRHRLRAQSSALAQTSTGVHGFAQTRVPGVPQGNEFGFAVAAVAQTLHVKFGAGLVKVKLRPLAAVRARDHAKVARFEKARTEGAIAQARRFQTAVLRATETAWRATKFCGHRTLIR